MKIQNNVTSEKIATGCNGMVGKLTDSATGGLSVVFGEPGDRGAEAAHGGAGEARGGAGEGDRPSRLGDSGSSRGGGGGAAGVHVRR